MDVLRSKVLLVDDHPLFRTGLSMTLGAEPDLDVVAQAGSADEALAAVQAGAIDIAVVDVLMPTTTGFALVGALKDIRADLRILALSVIDEPSMIAAMLRAGASGYALKTQSSDHVLEAIRAVLAGQRYLPPSVRHDELLALDAADAGDTLQRLTPREREIFDLLIQGETNHDIARRLFISRRTVETHRQRIMKKLATSSIIDMIRVAARQGALH